MKLLDVFKRQKTASSTTYKIIPRKVKFDWEQTPIDWIPHEPFASYFINQINMILPAGEFWFCRLYNKALPMITDQKLKEDVQAFIRQEAMHARAHTSAVNEYLSERKIDPQPNLDIMDWLFEKALADKPFDLTVPKLLDKQWLLLRLGIIATVEHMTCVLGKYALYNTIWEKLDADPELLDLLRWHGAEEIEHRSVAFDLYKHLGGNYISRYYLSLVAVPAVILLWVDGAARMMAQDPRLAAHKPSVFKPWVWREWSRVASRKLLPSPVWLSLQQVSYFSPWYDPVLEADTDDAVAYLEKSPAALRAASVV